MTISGWLIIDKPLGLSSTQVGGKIPRSLKIKKLGHVGTLDPLATGVLVIALGEATKLIPYLPTTLKVYEFEVRWGASTDTDDAEGQIIQQCQVYPTLSAINNALPHFLGQIDQVPPIYSAIKIQGQPAYKAARKGETPLMKTRQVSIHDLRVVEMVDEQTTRFQVKCGGGTYVRSLARDIALHLGTYGHIHSLRRLQDGLFGIHDTISLEKILEMGHKSEEHSLIKPIEAVLDDIPAVLVSEDDAQRIRQGMDIQSDLKIGTRNEQPVALFYKDKLLAIAVLKEGRLHPRRVFNLTP
ncbi:tRNA pseudouridine(55) synthase TruB [Candidatus Finniella inopinata]|uniref:tRNA pseudouridine synthase B n=1 Tax=Candidatus Finniella inopinata TaxID=1696036 RepID=A0A4Q7DPI0_9PROT|nr:tRNA pseudouridine(55) synthase TruB [Candidatus Finniella inopinata]RZI46906.1 tRNA pseudouridine(55) synthase TruB [Candidatus Finniella inopinata]